VEELLARAVGFPRRSLDPDEVLILDGEPVRALFVLVDGGLRDPRWP
jgi:hypothetical protein